ncbi:MAG TPA: hypothetical protein VJ204_01535 [Solirubrobacterales bacterium]|nr:hypothetical protein [Solirubrobacterales bacterium]
MSVKIGQWVFDDVDYDADADVLYLSIGQPRRGYGQESPEGHVWRFDSDGTFCGLTLIGVQGFVDAGDEMTITVPMPPRPELLDMNSLNRVLIDA